jgi:hypothetical protein
VRKAVPRQLPESVLRIGSGASGRCARGGAGGGTGHSSPERGEDGVGVGAGGR